MTQTIAPLESVWLGKCVAQHEAVRVYEGKNEYELWLVAQEVTFAQDGTDQVTNRQFMVNVGSIYTLDNLVEVVEEIYDNLIYPKKEAK